MARKRPIEPVVRAVVPAAGLGTRFLPATKAIPKELLPIVDRPVVQYIFEEAVLSGMREVVLVVARGKECIENHFDAVPELEEFLRRTGREDLARLVRPFPGVKVTAVRQPRPRGLGDAILCAEHVVDDAPFAVLLPDDLVDAEVPCLAQMLALYRETGGAIVALQRVAPEEVSRYGIVRGARDRSGRFRIRGIVEKPRAGRAPGNLAVIGRYILPPRVFAYLRKARPGAGGEIQLTDALSALARSTPVYGLEFRGRRYDAGDKVGFLTANLALALKRPELRRPLRQVVERLLADGE